MTITKMMMTSTPMMTPIIPRFMAGPPLVLLGVPAYRGHKHVPLGCYLLARALMVLSELCSAESVASILK